jgi:hypothetical protein
MARVDVRQLVHCVQNNSQSSLDSHFLLTISEQLEKSVKGTGQGQVRRKCGVKVIEERHVMLQVFEEVEERGGLQC